MSTVSVSSIELPARRVVLAPRWELHGDEPMMQVQPNGFLLNRTLQDWVKGNSDSVSYVVVSSDPSDDNIFLERVGDTEYLARTLVDRGVIQHWGLYRLLEAKGYKPGAELVFSETDDENIIAATVVRRGA